MARWLFKEEPEHFSFADLRKNGRTVWDGITNALARKNLRQVRKGDRVFYYHTGKEKAIVGVMRVVADPRPDPAGDDKSVVVDVEPVRALKRAVTLAEIEEEDLTESGELIEV